MGDPADARDLPSIDEVAERWAVEEELRRSQARLAEAQRLARLGSWEWDVTTNTVTWSDELYRIYGADPQAFPASYEGFMERVHPDDREAVQARNERAFADHEPFEDVKRVCRMDGSEFLMRTKGEVVCDAEGNVLRMLGVCEDVTAEIRAHEAESLLASIVRSSADAIYTVDDAGRVTSWNPAAERLFGVRSPHVLGTEAARFVPEHDRATEAGRLVDVLRGRPVEPWDTQRRCADGRLVEVSMSCSPVHDQDGTVTGVALIARDMTERRRLEAELRHLVDHDVLTGLPNRRRFEGDLRDAVARASRHGVPGALLMLDLDDFKFVNDTLGHAAGDELLRSVGATLARRLRVTDVLARLGGDEFGVLLDRTSLEEAQHVANDLLRALREHSLVIERRALSVTTSIGVVPFAGGEDVGMLLATADRAMYEAKDAGRDRLALLAPGREEHPVPAIGWEARIREALAADQFVLFGQPILDLATGEVHRYELLLRLDDGGDLVPPAAFLGVAERLGLIHAIDRWVTKQAIGLVAQYPHLEFEVNISGRSMDDPDLLALIRSELTRTGADPSKLVFEITETATIASLGDAREFSEALARVGCRFAIDDFGAGFGSFFYLKHLPASILKIDGDFIKSPRTRTDELIIASMVDIARGLDKVTVAEFVGDTETLNMLRAVGVDFAQGFHVGRPFPVAELRAAA